MNRFDEISALLQKGRPRELSALVKEELEDGTSANDILLKALIPGMSVVGERFKKNEIFVPEVLITARAMNAALNILKPVLAQAGVEPVGTAVICTVKGDLHDIGKNLVKMMIEGTGIRVIDLGVDCPPERVVEAVKEYHPDIVCLSALLTTTMVNHRRAERSGASRSGQGDGGRRSRHEDVCRRDRRGRIYARRGDRRGSREGIFRLRLFGKERT